MSCERNTVILSAAAMVCPLGEREMGSAMMTVWGHERRGSDVCSRSKVGMATLLVDAKCQLQTSAKSPKVWWRG